MRIFVIIINLLIFTSNYSFSQNLQKIDTIKIDTISNLRRFSFGIKIGIPNVIGLTTEAILPIFKNRVSPYFDYSSFKLNPDKTVIDLNYTDYGINMEDSNDAGNWPNTFGSAPFSGTFVFEEATPQ